VNARTFAIALTSFREALRDRILFAVLGLGAASVLFGLGLGSLSYAESVRIVVDHGLVTISLLANLIAIFLGANFLYKELELRTLYVLLAKPVARHELVLGKYLGILFTIAVFVTATAALLLAVVTLTAADDSFSAAQRLEAAVGPAMHLVRSRGLRLAALGAVLALIPLPLVFPRLRRALTLAAVLPLCAALLAGFASLAYVVAPAETVFVLVGSLLVFAEVTVTAAVSMLFSSFSTPFVTAILSFGVFAISRSTWLMQHLPRRNFPAAARSLLHGIARVVPNLHLFVPERAVLLSDDPDHPLARYVALALAYAALWAAGLLVASSLLFRRRDLV
jgi:ABC-type transport system involved in multi-copper enzyme maturation permease subunit